MRNIKLCFISSNAYPLLIGRDITNIIGPDVHQCLLAKEFSSNNFESSIISDTPNEKSSEYYNGVKIIKHPKFKTRFNIINILLEVVGLWIAMSKANADIYFHAGGMAGSISPFCRLMRKKYVYEIASDALLNGAIIKCDSKEFKKSKFNLSRIGNWLDIKLADVIVVQTKHQRNLLKDNYHKNGFLIKMPFQISNKKIKKNLSVPIVLWVGSMAKVKQPELILELARRIPFLKFIIIGGHSEENKSLFDDISKEAKKLENTDFLGVIPFSKIDKYFEEATLLVNTSAFEGFPHSFIQAWMNYIPIISLNADPDDLLCQAGLGIRSRDFEKLVRDVVLLANDNELTYKIGLRGRDYVEREHDIRIIKSKYIDIINKLINS